MLWCTSRHCSVTSSVQRLERLNLLSPFVLRSVDPPIDSINGRTITGVRRIDQRISRFRDPSVPRGRRRVEGDDLFLVIHLMIAGRLRWRAPGQKPGMGPKLILASFQFANGTLFFTEASSKKRASIQLRARRAALQALDPGGLEPLGRHARAVSRRADAREPHARNASLTDPHLFSGIGNAYSDEILHAAQALAVEADAHAVGRGIRCACSTRRGRRCACGSITCASR